MSQPSGIRNEFIAMLKRYEKGKASQEEVDFIEKYMNHLEKNMPGGAQGLNADALTELEKETWQKLLTNIQQAKPASPVRPLRKWLPVAAAIFILAAAGTVVWYYNRPLHQNNIQVKNDTTPPGDNDVLPGGNKAVLKLADGTSIILDSAKNGMLAAQGSASILKVGDGQLSYADAHTENEEPASYNTLITPQGGQYMLVLADGSKVWLNAASSLYYPAKFTGKERRVKLTGEGYFEVVHNPKQPFIVECEGIEVHDIGTSFNINAYKDEQDIVTTLVTGAASVHKNADKVLLHPGRQAIVSGNSIKEAEADMEYALAWKNGLFSFADADIKTVMRQIQRWYDVDMRYEGAVSKHFNGTISRNNKASAVFNMLQMTGGVHFTIDDKTIIVRP